MEDVAISRAKKTRFYSTDNVANIPADANRLAIRLISGVGATAQLEVASPVFANGAASIPLILSASYVDNIGALNDAPPAQWVEDVTLDDVGDCLKGPLRLRSIGGADVFAVEVYLDIETPSLAKYLQNFQKIHGS